MTPAKFNPCFIVPLVIVDNYAIHIKDQNHTNIVAVEKYILDASKLWNQFLFLTNDADYKKLALLKFFRLNF